MLIEYPLLDRSNSRSICLNNVIRTGVDLVPRKGVKRLRKYPHKGGPALSEQFYHLAAEINDRLGILLSSRARLAHIVERPHRFGRCRSRVHLPSGNAKFT